MRTYYDVLNVSPESESVVIQAAFRALSMKYHPDHDPDHADQMKLINEAYTVLRDPQRRATYDAELLTAARDAQPERANAPPEAGGERNCGTISPTPDIDLKYAVELTRERDELVHEARYYGIILWIAIPWLAGWASRSNFGPKAQMPGLALALLLLAFFVLWKPLGSTFKVMMLVSARASTRLVTALAGGYLIIRIGYLILSGELKSSGLSGVSLSSVFVAATWLLLAMIIRVVIEVVTRRDNKRRLKLLMETGNYNFTPLSF